MGIQTFPTPSATSPNDWTLVASSAPSGVSTVTFSSLSGYKKYRIIIDKAMTMSTGGGINVRFNGDSTYGNYAYRGRSNTWNSTTENVYGNDSVFPLADYVNGAISSNGHGYVEVDNANIAAAKFLRGQGATNCPGDGSKTSSHEYIGSYASTAAITSVTVFTTAAGTSNFSGANIYLLGAN